MLNAPTKFLCAAAIAVAGSNAAASVIGLVDFDGTQTGLVSYTNDALVGGGISTNGNLAAAETYAVFSFAGDAFNPMSRSSRSPFETDAGQAGMPFNITDDSVVAATGNGTFANDTQGFAGQGKADGFFGITDNSNFANQPPSQNTATFVFDISGFKDLAIAIDFAAMGSFVSAHTFSVDYEIDGGGFNTVFLGSVVAGATQTYFMDSGTQVDLLDPYAINGTTLNDNFLTLTAGLAGNGSVLTVRATGSFYGQPALGFDNLTIRGIPEPPLMSLLAMAGLIALSRRRRPKAARRPRPE